MSRLAIPVALATLAGALVLLPSPHAHASTPYFGTNYDCSPILTDAEALAVTGTKRNVVESARVGDGGYFCSWSVATKKTRAITLAVEVRHLNEHNLRAKVAKTYCDPNGPLPLSKAAKEQVCEAAEAFVYVKTPRAAFDAYSTLVRMLGKGSAKIRFDEGGVRGYYISGKAGAAMTMLPRSWTVVTAACLDMAAMEVERTCSIKALGAVLRNFRLAGDESGALSPVPKKKTAKTK